VVEEVGEEELAAFYLGGIHAQGVLRCHPPRSNQGNNKPLHNEEGKKND
jgi:hypothetical protein